MGGLPPVLRLGSTGNVRKGGLEDLLPGLGLGSIGNVRGMG